MTILEDLNRLKLANGILNKSSGRLGVKPLYLVNFDVEQRHTAVESVAVLEPEEELIEETALSNDPEQADAEELRNRMSQKRIDIDKIIAKIKADRVKKKSIIE